jgi:cation:H+ antiporter
MLFDILLLLLGMAILVVGGEFLVKGASSLARGLGISPLVIGLTVVAFGTSAPELAVNVGAALRETGALSFGNIFGSNLANIGLIIGLVAMLSPIHIDNILIRRELPMLMLATAAAGIMAFDVDLGGRSNVYERGDGLILLLFFVVFLFYTVGDLMNSRNGSDSNDVVAGTATIDLSSLDGGAPPNLWRDGALLLLGLAALIGGAHMTVGAAVDVARYFEVPEVLIGLTVISVGTSLPELVAAISAVRHGRSDMAVGSVVGSNIFNTLLVLGTTATIEPLRIPPGGHMDIIVTALLSLAFTFVARTHNRLIIRSEGGLLMLFYLAYVTWRSIVMVTSGPPV